MKREWRLLIVITVLLVFSLGCGFSIDIGNQTATPTLIPATNTPTATNTATLAPSPTPAPTDTPTATQAPATPTAIPTATPLPPPEVISPANIDRLTYKRAFGTGALTKIQVSPDGKSVLLAYTARLVLLNLSDLSLIWQVDPGRYLLDITFSQNGSRLISTTPGGLVEIRDTSNGALINTTVTQKEGVVFNSLFPSGNYLALLDYSGKTSIWDTATGKQIQSNNGLAFPGGITSMLASPDDNTFIIGGVDSKLKQQMLQWKVDDGSFKIGLTGLQPVMVAWKYSPDGKRFYSVNNRSLTAKPATVLSSWDTTSGKPVKTFSGKDLITDYLPSPDGKSVLIATKDRLLKLLDADSGAELGSFPAENTDIVGMAFTPDSQSIISITTDGKVKVWDAFTKKVLRETAGLTPFSYATVAISTNIQRIAILSPSRTSVGILDTADWTGNHELGAGEAKYHALAISSQGKLVAACDEKNNVLVWEIDSGKELQRIQAKTRYPIKQLKFSPDEALISSLSEGQVLTWEVSTGKKLKDSAGYNTFDYSPDSKLVAADSVDYGLYITDVASGKMAASIKAEYIFAITYAPDGRQIAVGARKVQAKEAGLVNLIYLVDTQTKQRLDVTMPELPGAVQDMAFSPGGELLASSDGQGNLSIWSLRDGKQLIQYEGIVCGPANLQFSSDGSLLLVGGGDGTVAMVSTSPGISVSQGNSQPVSGATIPDISAEPFSQSKGLLTINLPVGWKVQELSELTISSADPGKTASIMVSAINTFAPLNGDSFTKIISAFEQYYALTDEGYQEIAKNIDEPNGQAFVTKAVKIGDADYFWETYYTRAGAVFYQVNFITAKAMADAMLPLYKKVYSSIKINQEFVMAQPPYYEKRTFTDPDGYFSFKIPMGWSIDNTSDATSTANLYTAPDGNAFLNSIGVTVEQGGKMDATQLETVAHSYLGSLDKSYWITSKKTTPSGDLIMAFELTTEKTKGFIICSSFDTKVHLLSAAYSSSLEKEYGPLIEDLINSYTTQSK